MNRDFLARQGVLLCLLAIATPAQSAAPTAARIGSSLPVAVPPIPIHRASDDLGQPYGTWAGGSTYKVSFHDGMTFVPYLGRDYPRNQPLSWRTRSVRRGGVELIEPGEQPSHASSAYRYEYRYRGLTEAYDVLDSGLEQTFVFDRLPAGGDLVIEGAVSSRLRAEAAAPAHGALVFRDADGRPIVRYGEAFAFDADGDTIGLATELDGRTIRLHVPDAWLARARFPIVVDPFFTLPNQLAQSSFAVLSTDTIGRDNDAAAASVMVGYTVFASLADSDTFVLLTDDDFTNPVVVYSDTTSSWDSDGVSCAYVGGADRWAVVLRRHFINNPVRVSQLRCHVHASGDTSFSTGYISLVPPIDDNDWRVDVGGSAATAAGTKALAVFQREHNAATNGHFTNSAASDVHGVLIDLSTPTGMFGTPFSIDVSLFHDSEAPSVNQLAEGGGAFSWICVLQRYDNAVQGDEWDLVGRRISNNGTLSLGTFTSDLWQQGTDHQLKPIVEGRNGRYAVLFTTASLATTPGKTSSLYGDAIRIERFDWDHIAASPSPTGDLPPVVLEDDPSATWTGSGLGYDVNDRSHWTALFQGSTGFARPARYARVGYNGELTEGPATFGSTNAAPPVCAFDSDNDTFLIVRAANSLPQQVVWGHVLDYVNPAPTSHGGQGCNPTVLRWVGNQQIGAEFNRAVALGAPAGSGHFLAVSLATADLPVVDPAVVPGCRLLIDTGPAFLGTMGFQVGSTVSWPFALPEWLPPLTLHFQDWIFDGATFTSSRRLSVPVIR